VTGVEAKASKPRPVVFKIKAKALFSADAKVTIFVLKPFS